MSSPVHDTAKSKEARIRRVDHLGEGSAERPTFAARCPRRHASQTVSTTILAVDTMSARAVGGHDSSASVCFRPACELVVYQKVLPFRGRVGPIRQPSISRSPWISSFRPGPRISGDRSSACEPSKIRCCASAGMPMPVSTTSIRTVTVSSFPIRAAPGSPLARSVNFTALRAGSGDLAQEVRVPLRRKGIRVPFLEQAEVLPRAAARRSPELFFTSRGGHPEIWTRTFPASILEWSGLSCMHVHERPGRGVGLLADSSCSAVSTPSTGAGRSADDPFKGCASVAHVSRKRFFARLASSAFLAATVSFFRRAEI